MSASRPADSAEVRSELIRVLELDLIGPRDADELSTEALPQSPSRWYLTGFLAPLAGSEEDRTDPAALEEVDEPGEKGGVDDASTPEPASAKKVFFPSSIGLSTLVPQSLRTLTVTARWGDYRRPSAAELKALEETPQGYDIDEQSWLRRAREERMTVSLPAGGSTPLEIDVPKSRGLKIVVSHRPVTGGADNVAAASSLSVFLVNRRAPVAEGERDESFAFQAEIELEASESFLPRPNLCGVDRDDWDERVADLQYRDAFELAVGHGVATLALPKEDGSCSRLRTCWIPCAAVERVAPEEIRGVELSMEALAELPDGNAAKAALIGLVTEYRTWIAGQRGILPSLPKNRADVADVLLRRATTASDRIEAGINCLADPQVIEAFRLANLTMARAARRRSANQKQMAPADVDAPRWRPFQLAFILMNLRGIAEPAHDDRELVDLLFFPTGGGKTEAYLGLAAFTLVLRRLRNPGLTSAGVSVIMRYTLRLLTLDQLGRAAALICALELERQANPEKLGTWPFEIGLWVGMAATPNRMGAKGDGDSYSARTKTIAFKNDDRKPSPIPIEECPWCGTRFKATSFQLIPNPDFPIDLRVLCVNRSCEFRGSRPLPILGVDEPIYRRLPCFLIATVDKFAAMPWTGEVGNFFGMANRSDSAGFYGPSTPDVGVPLPAPLPPPDLIIQDELHLISGPMGTVVGLYESALEELCTREVEGKKIRPKIIASTATVRRAESQIRALFGRNNVDIFPPPGPDRRDSFFARVHSAQESHPRFYLGVAAQGRSLKVVLLRTYLALLGAAQKAYDASGGKRNKSNPADPYMTLVGYFNSLRELGGSRRIIEDEVSSRLENYEGRMREGEASGPFANRKIAYEVVELTSRVSTDKVSEAKRRLALPFFEKDRVDVAIATNMISVGLDITRLGLMVVLGQPKTSAEYIQATSRVGRDAKRPGLVVTLLNVHRPRDRSHFERFAAYHESFYRSVEASSVTPFSPRALDRGLVGTVVALARHGHNPMAPPRGAERILQERTALDFVVDRLGDRAFNHAQLSNTDAQTLRQSVRARVADLLDEWLVIARDFGKQGIGLQYQREVGAAQRLLYQFLDPELENLSPRQRKFRANRSMRDVEPNVNLWMKTPDGIDVEEDAE